MQTLVSQIDETVNFIQDHRDGKVESRYVKRRDDDFTCYLSSHNGCNKGCKFCWLTQTKQFQFHPVAPLDLINQAIPVLQHGLKDVRNKQVNFSFMSRGEPLSSPWIQSYWYNIANGLVSNCMHLAPTFNISTIMPKDIEDLSLRKIFSTFSPTIYYSVYANEEFKQKWMPGAMDIYKALTMLSDYQQFSQKILKLHGAFIAGENDDFNSWIELAGLINVLDLRVQFQAVRYNPFDDSKESEHLEELLSVFHHHLQQPVIVVDRVGPDVYGSCGMFINE